MDAARLRHDPDQVRTTEEQALDGRGVWVHPDHRSPAVTHLEMVLDTPDALTLDRHVGDLATQLGRLGDHRDLQIRRATAAGILAHPQTALDLLTGHQTALPPSPGPARRVELFVHLTDTTLHAADTDVEENEPGPVEAERLRTLTGRLLGDWLTRHQAAGGTIRLTPVLAPVLALGRDDAVDAHDPPGWMRDLVVLRDAHCVFPGCRRDSRSCDLDHMLPYVPPDQGGPPGQTRPSNLAPLCRSHHRAKTHGGWDYHRVPTPLDQPDPVSTYSWTSPHGHTHTVTVPSRRPRP